MMQARVSCGLEFDPGEGWALDDKIWAAASLKANVDRERDAPSLWIGSVLVGRCAHNLPSHSKRDGHSGELHERLEMVPDPMIGGRTLLRAKGRPTAVAVRPIRREMGNDRFGA